VRRISEALSSSGGTQKRMFVSISENVVLRLSQTLTVFHTG
jgi:hypothetical protein